MSVFEEKTEAKETTETSDSYFERLVGEDKKFKTEEDLAKGKWESDEYIQHLKAEVEQMRSDIAKEDKVNELLELVRSQNGQGTQNTTSGQGGGNDNAGGGEDPNDTSSGLTEERLRTLIESTVSEREATSQRQKNLGEVETTLEGAYGEKSGEFLKGKASELGMSLKEMEDVAARNPRAFFQLVGLNQKSSNQSTFVGGSRSTEGDAKTKTGRRNFNYWNELRKTDKKRYYSPENQHQRFMDAKEQGPAFYED